VNSWSLVRRCEKFGLHSRSPFLVWCQFFRCSFKSKCRSWLGDLATTLEERDDIGPRVYNDEE